MDLRRWGRVGVFGVAPVVTMTMTMTMTTTMMTMTMTMITAGAAVAGGSPRPALGDCPASGLRASAETIDLRGDCVIVGDVKLSGTATLSMTGGTLGIVGNVSLGDEAKLTVTGGGLVFPQSGYSQYSITLNGRSQWKMKDSVLVTNGTGQNNFSMELEANDAAGAYFENSNLDTNGGSWLLGNFNGHSRLAMIHTQDLPTEIYPADGARIAISGESSFAALWLQFAPGSRGTVEIPREDSMGRYSFGFGPGTGIGYEVRVSSSQGELGLNSFPGSTMIVKGHGLAGANDAGVVLGYYIQDSTGAVGLDGLEGGGDITRRFTDQGRDLELRHVNLGPFSWQVYVSGSDNFPVWITNSKINEIGVLRGGLVNLENSVLQLAVTEAAGPGAVLNIKNTQIWSQTVQAQDGGQMNISDSQLHGNFIAADGAGSSIAMKYVGESGNGVAPQSCAAVNGFPPNDGGVPLCNPFNPLYQCSQVTPPAGGATIAATPGLTCPPQ